MSATHSEEPTRASSRRPLAATAREFAPAPTITVANEVLDATFVTQALPDIHPDSGIVGLCAVPSDRAGMEDMGWHIADFLAFRTLLNGKNHPKAQTWLSQSDIAGLVREHPERYVHGKDRRVVGPASETATIKQKNGDVDREDNTRVVSSIEQLKAAFLAAIREKAAIVKKHKYPLVIIVCGLTSLEQDIFFEKSSTDDTETGPENDDGQENGAEQDIKSERGSLTGQGGQGGHDVEAATRCTNSEIRNEAGEDIEAILITPALFSAGWQVNASFCRSPATATHADRTDFLARQFGGIFAKVLVEQFLGWKCPMLDAEKVDQADEGFPGPAKPSEEVRTRIDNLKTKVQSYLVGRFSTHHQDHSFSFDIEKDDWAMLIGERKHASLDTIKERWEKVESLGATQSNQDNLAFLGTAFGGTRSSQLNHIKHLIKESFEAWPGYWATGFGQNAKRIFEKFMNTVAPEILDCHEIFNVLEHRATTSVLADMIVQYLNLHKPNEDRCRDWNFLRWKDVTSSADQYFLLGLFQGIVSNIPGPNVPPGINPNHLSKIQRRLESYANYVCASLCLRYLGDVKGANTAVKLIKELLDGVRLRQAELLVMDSELRDTCSAWLNAIDMPIRGLDDTKASAGDVQGIAAPEKAYAPDDEDGDYIVSREDHPANSSAPLFDLYGSAASPASPVPRFEVLDDGDVGQLRKQFGEKLDLIKELFPEWSDADILYALKETDGDVEVAATRMAAGRLPVQDKENEVQKPENVAAPAAENFVSEKEARPKSAMPVLSTFPPPPVAEDIEVPLPLTIAERIQAARVHEDHLFQDLLATTDAQHRDVLISEMGQVREKIRALVREAEEEMRDIAKSSVAFVVPSITVNEAPEPGSMAPVDFNTGADLSKPASEAEQNTAKTTSGASSTGGWVPPHLRNPKTTAKPASEAKQNIAETTSGVVSTDEWGSPHLRTTASTNGVNAGCYLAEEASEVEQGIAEATSGASPAGRWAPPHLRTSPALKQNGEIRESIPATPAKQQDTAPPMPRRTPPHLRLRK
ncbi:Uu.00g114770.m01.CDS01 [Anthostomella pinea]|uniref:RNA polymerase II degradation factor 1 n=1 Tax=Anthostomella pinea TaxID=933095 RepID=A0AAI8VFR5_9PEZI|nr:Uu.00g114770.m01.CDS01 [Anthostomella pinea]